MKKTPLIRTIGERTLLGLRVKSTCNKFKFEGTKRVSRSDELG